jgi:hypothetical protein
VAFRGRHQLTRRDLTDDQSQIQIAIGDLGDINTANFAEITLVTLGHRTGPMELTETGEWQMAGSIIIEAEGKVGTLDAVAVSDDCLNVISGHGMAENTSPKRKRVHSGHSFEGKALACASGLCMSDTAGQSQAT